jgi:membrane protein
MKLGAKGYLGLFKTAGKDWVDDHAPRLGAALAFYTIFSLAPLVTIVLTAASLWFSDNPEKANEVVYGSLASAVGTEKAQDLKETMVQPGKEKSGVFTAIAAGVMLLFGATGVFIQLQDSLNEIWEVEQKPGQGIWGFIRHRLLSFAMILAIGFLLLSSLLLSAGLAAMGKFFIGMLGDMTPVMHALNFVVSFGLITVLFACMFKYVPDAKIGWRDVWFGAFVTSILFTVGKFGLGMYLGKSSIVSTYAAAGGLLIVVLWVYYTSQIVFFGAELTQAYATAMGREVQPSRHAQWDEEKVCAKEQAVKKREEKKIATGKAFPEPAYMMQTGAMTAAAAGSAPGAVKGRKGVGGKAFGGIVLLLLALLPFEKKIFKSSKV